MKKYINKGFTLLELLVVIGIIGVIMALATVAYTATQKSSRDARRKQDLVAIQNALEQYYATNGYVYPSGVTSCKEAQDHMKGEWPTDPSDDDDYSGVTDCASDTYCICAAMETGTDNGNSLDENCDFSGAGNKTYYCVGSLQ